MSYIIVDVEADGPIPAEFSMVSFGAVVFDDRLDRTFYGKTRPISDRFVPEALAVSGFASRATEWKKYRVTAHTHNPVDDARGNAEALKKFHELGLKL